MKKNYLPKLRPTFRIASLAIGLAVFIMFAMPAVAQDNSGSVHGTVTDDKGNPVAGAAITIEGTPIGTVSDNKGAFSLTPVSSDNTLIVSAGGFITQAIRVGNRTEHNISLEDALANQMEEIVVIGYGAVKKSDLTGSVATVKMTDIKDVPVVSVDQALQGRIAGVDIMSTTGEPGSTTSIRIRGTRSITAGNEPLIVVDGVIDAVRDLNDINSADIASISILKDASSSAIYGTRGSNGVIIITTKQGSGSLRKPSISFKADIGFSELPSNLDIMNAAEFAQYRNDHVYFGNANYPDVKPNSPLADYPYKDPLSLGEGTNWINEISRRALYQNYSLSLSGRSDKSSWLASFSYNETQGIIDKSGLERITGRINANRQLFSWMKIGYNGSYTWRHNDKNNANIGGTSWWNSAQYLSPLLAPNADFNPLWYNGQKMNTPRHLIDRVTNYQEFHTSSHTFDVEIKPVEHMVLKSQASYFLHQRHSYRYEPGNLPAKTEDQGGVAERGEYDEFHLSSETTLTYAREFESGHSFDVMAGYSAYKDRSNNLSVSGGGYMDDIVKWENMNAVLDKETYNVGTTGFSDRLKMSYYARTNYNYKSRYYLTLTGRFDGSSNFAPNRRWAFFPSAALKWNVANEQFMQNANWIDELGIRLSAGRTGNEAIPAYRSSAALSSTTGGYLFDGKQPAAFYPSRIGSPDLTWETTDSYNLALDMSFLKDRIRVTAETYYTKTTDLLLNVQVATQTGYSSRFVNIGSTSNKGVEFTIESQNFVKPKFFWSTSFTISHNSQMVNDIGTEDFVSALNGPGNNSYMMYGYVKGYPLNSLWGFKYGGVWHNQEEVERNKVTKTYVSPSSTANGIVRYYDVNHDGTLNQDDLIYQGSADPFIYGGLQNTFNFHNFNLGIYFTYSLGGKIYNYAEMWMSGSQFTNQYRYMLDSWHPIRNPESNLPRAGSIDTHTSSDLQIHDASFLRLKNVSLGYTFDMSKKVKWMNTITLNVSGENLWLWKKYNGFDPDVSSQGTSSVLRRVDIGAYPKPRTVIFSVQFTY